MRRLSAALGLALALSLALQSSAAAAGIERTYPVGNEPFGVTIDPADGRVYVTNSDGGSGNPGLLSVVDPTTPPCSPTPCGVSSIALGSPPVMSVLDRGLRKLFVTTTDRTLTVVDTATQNVVQTIPNAGGLGIAIDESTHRVYAASQTSLSMVDGMTGTVLQTVPAGVNDDWWGVAVDASARRVYVTNLDLSAPSLVVLDSDDLSLIGEVPLPERPRFALAVDAVRQLVYVGGYSYGGSLYVVDATSLQITSAVDLHTAAGFPQWATLVTPQDRLYVSLGSNGFGADSIVVLDLASLQVVQQIWLPWQPGANALHQDGRLYVAGYSVDVLAAVDLENAAPVIDSIRFSPPQPSRNDVLRAIVSAYDPDGDSLTYSYQWLRNGVTIAGATGQLLDLSVAGHGDRGDTITVRVTVTDPQGLATQASASVVVANAPPLLTVVLSSETPGTNDVLTASAVATDADGDPVTVTYEWLRNGVVVPEATTATLDLGVYGDQGDRIVVRVTASDGEGGVKIVAKTALILPSTGSFLYLNSQPGDWVGGGLQQLFIEPNPTFQAWLARGGDTFRADIGGARWGVVMSAPIGVPLAVGTYTGVARSAFRPAGVPGLDVSGDNHGCNTLTGQFTVSELAFSQYDEVMLFDATFEQHCDGAVPALFGRIHMEIPPPTPGVTLPAGSIAVPTSGSYLYMNSQGGDYIGQGREHLYTWADSGVYGALALGGSNFGGSIVQGNTHWWSVDLRAPQGQPLALGSYIRAVRAPFQPAGSPGLSVTGDGRGCNTLTGKFDIDELSYSTRGDLLVFQATFEQHCEGGPAALYGRIRVEIPTSSPGVTLPSGSVSVPTSGTFLYVNSAPGELVGAGLEQLYTSADSAMTSSLSATVDYFRATVAQGGHTWSVDIASPQGQPLSSGSYVKAIRAAARTIQSGLDIRADGRSCTDIAGKFDLNELSFWPNGELRVFQATFQQQCFGKALIGRVRIEMAGPIELAVTMRADGSVTNKSGVAIVAGTLSCSRPAPVDLVVTLTQVQSKNVTVTGTATVRVNCAGPAAAWSLAVSPQGGAFKAGSASASWDATVCESGRSCVSAPGTRSIKLNVAK